MKKLLLSSGLLLGCLATAQAQQSPSRFGIKGGGTLATFVGKDITSTSSTKLGFHGGLVACLGISDRFSIQPELLYSMKGTQDEATYGSVTVKGYETLHYLDVPVLAKVKFTPLFLEAGPQVGVLLEAKSTVESRGISTTNSNKSSFKDVDLGYAVGLGIEAANGLMVGLRYNGGLVDIPKPQTVNGRTLQAEARNSALQLYVGFIFNGK